SSVKLPLNDHVKQLLDKTHALDFPHLRQYLAHEAFHNLILPTIPMLPALDHLHEIGTSSVTSMSSGSSISPDSNLGKSVSRIFTNLMFSSDNCCCFNCMLEKTLWNLFNLLSSGTRIVIFSKSGFDSPDITLPVACAFNLLILLKTKWYSNSEYSLL